MTKEQIHIGSMSHETAIGILKLMLEAMETYDGISPTPERVNAVKMAIEALEQESTFQKKAEIVISQLRADRDRLQDAFDKIRDQLKSNLRGVEIALEVLVENDPLRPKMEGAKTTLEDCLELIEQADRSEE